MSIRTVSCLCLCSGVKRTKLGALRKNGFLIFPRQDKSFFETYRIKETDGTLKKVGLAIPQTTENFKEYIKTMNVNEEELKQHLMTNKTLNA